MLAKQGKLDIDKIEQNRRLIPHKFRNQKRTF